MAEKLNSFEKFWKELKRRKVFSVVTTYAATAYIIIEVTNNLAVPLHMPDWFAALVLVILIIGLPIVTILTWIFDFTPKGIEKTVSLKESEGKEIIVIPVKRRLRASYVLNAILILAVVILAYSRIFKQDRLEKLRTKGTLSVAVMPFQNMTNDTIWDVWQDGIKDILTTSLSNSEELKVRQSESVNSLIEKNGITNYASITPALASVISKKLSANVFTYGSIKQAGGTLRLNVRLMDSEKDEIIQSFQIESLANEENIFQIIDSLSIMVKDFLIISKLGKEVTPEMRHLASTSSPEAYRYFIYGNKAFMKQDYSSCVKFLSQAVTIDSNFTFATLHLAIANGNQGLYEEAKRWCLKAYEKKDQMPIWSLL